VEDLVDEDAAGGDGLVVGEVFGLVGVEPEAGGDEQEDAATEKEAALPFQAGLAEQSFEGAVGHITLSGATKKGSGPICRNGPSGASHKWGLAPFSWPSHAF